MSAPVLLAGVDRLLRTNAEHMKGAAVIGWNTTCDEHVNNYTSEDEFYSRKQLDDILEMDSNNGHISSLVCLFAPLEYLNKNIFSEKKMVVSADDISVVQRRNEDKVPWSDQNCRLGVEIWTDGEWKKFEFVKLAVQEKLIEPVIENNEQAVKDYDAIILRVRTALYACKTTLPEMTVWSGIIPRFLDGAAEAGAPEAGAPDAEGEVTEGEATEGEHSDKDRDAVALTMWEELQNEFVATSTDQQQAQEFAVWDSAKNAYLFELHIEAGAVGFDIGNQLDSEWRCFPNEKEVMLFPVNEFILMHYCVTKKGTTKDGTDLLNFVISLKVSKATRSPKTRWDDESIDDDPHWAEGGV